MKEKREERGESLSGRGKKKNLPPLVIRRRSREKRGRPFSSAWEK